MAADERQNLESLIRGLLAAERDVNAIEAPAYFSFGRQVASCKRKMLGSEKFERKIAGVVEKWTAAGLNRPVLLRILRDLFACELSTPSQD